MSNKIRVLAVIITAGLLLAPNSPGQIVSSEKPTPSEEKRGDVAKFYTASGWMGDGIEGTKCVQLNEVHKDNPKSKRTCAKITYTLGPQGWAGIYWLNEPDNWGDDPGDDFSKAGYTKITFRARGEKGGEVVEFKAGGIRNKKKEHKDSFAVSTGKLTLEKDWKHYEIKLQGKNLSSVIGVFCWVASGTSNPKGLTFYLDDIRYE